MIVDLVRNDLGKVCRGGSVKVKDHREIQAYTNVYHTLSTVTGTLTDEAQVSDTIKAVFPGGSITGCPKIRAMEIIDEIEKSKRHIYTGSIGFISHTGCISLNIAIRTALIKDNKLYFSAGGGIVFDSDPEKEYNETTIKAQTWLNVISHEK
jgi:para-aminobenzoate synthetase component 1